MLKTYIVEDNTAELSTVLDFLATKCPQTEVVGTSGEIEAAYVGIIETRPDLLIADINLTGGLCFELLNRLRTVDRLAELRIIFMTGFPDFDNAKNGYEYSPIAFLQKPFTSGELQAAVEKVGRPREIQQARQKMELFLELISGQIQTNQPLTVTLLKGELQLVDTGDIVYLETYGTMTTIYIKDAPKAIVSSRSLGHYTAMLKANKKFFSISKSILINLDYLERYDHSEKRVALRHTAKDVTAARSGGQELRQYLLHNAQPEVLPADSLKAFFKKIFGLND